MWLHISVDIFADPTEFSHNFYSLLAFGQCEFYMERNIDAQRMYEWISTCVYVRTKLRLAWVLGDCVVSYLRETKWAQTLAFAGYFMVN